MGWDLASTGHGNACAKAGKPIREILAARNEFSARDRGVAIPHVNARIHLGNPAKSQD